jgi:hypothetical protein
MGVLAFVKAVLDQPHLSLPIQRDQNSYALGGSGRTQHCDCGPTWDYGQFCGDSGDPALEQLSLHPVSGCYQESVAEYLSEEDGGNDIRLGDVVVSKSTASRWGCLV